MNDILENTQDDKGRGDSEIGKQRLPIRVRGGGIDGEYLVLYTTAEKKHIALEDIKLICLGIIREVIGDFDSPRSFLRNLLRSILFGEKEMDRQVPKTYREVYLVDIYVGESEIPYRIDSSFFDYRDFLEELEYISINNFRKLFRLLAESATSSMFDKNSVAFLRMRTQDLRKVASIYDYDLDSLDARRALQSQIPYHDINFDEFKDKKDDKESK
ncbi:MAG: hypothetical protein J7M18_03165 [Candidatus Eremiobacteraeota bacterium]|nr:hypothetical protein [Candidatus Eremiobacteraeota bacterium]